MTRQNLTPMLSTRYPGRHRSTSTTYVKVDHTGPAPKAYYYDFFEGRYMEIKADPPKQAWVWDKVSKRYHDSATGQYISAAKMVEYRDTFTDRQIERTDILVDSLVRGDITIQQMELSMREALKETYLAQYSAAKGGRQSMTKRDFGIIGRELRTQCNTYLRPFMLEIKEGKYSGKDLDSVAGQLKVRAGMYIDSSTKMFERGRSESMEAPVLPYYPGDGSTVCITKCRCGLHWTERPNGWAVKWDSEDDPNTCETCSKRGKAPALIIKNGKILNPKVWD